ncbi:putative GCN5-related N-acetyltransferase [Candidatus Competibacter denitrificans Run_A_D11]|uniref:GCN5-related N-acetyltransferase n=1 Tax=Candidatus Competibacter denitrificans Run_A_D11 TaxID=1400863 RepID=W6M2Z2_9GAMM|nr:GNAT family N-acetyltransferase [Candidatus Competibacter denitrificans]CDI01907.1 putative GCN5-related N-acetyltransferase [Candidatus Competibacter denitrificans Run_A_D11]HAS86165.1 GNAT family N-acetyltransferase [Candidatus Competibacteraceae bacterium]HRC68130.1 GNAT family N-acetyltransferase [Candidatus Competibacter denitrificans]
MKTDFFQESYGLAGCSLVRLCEADASVIAGQLAAMNPWQALNYSAAQLENYLLAPDSALNRYTVRVDGTIVGIVAVRYPWLKGPYLELIGLFPAVQRQGLGTAIMTWFENVAQPAATNLWVLVSSFNEPAQRFYRRYGFTEIGRIDALVYPHSTELLLRKVVRATG